MIFLLAIIAFLAFALWNTGSIPDYARTDRVFPFFVAAVALIGALILLVQMIFKPKTDVLFKDTESPNNASQAVFGMWPTLAWFAFC